MASPTPRPGARRGVVAGALVVVAVALVLVFTLGGGSDGEESSPTASGSIDGDLLPASNYERFDGAVGNFADFRGQPLVINFWASWCPACAAELPAFEAVHQALGEEVQFLGLANADDRSRGLALIEVSGVTYALGDDPRGDLFRGLGGLAMPTTIFVDADGRIVETFSGQLDEASLTARIQALIPAS